MESGFRAKENIQVHPFRVVALPRSTTIGQCTTTAWSQAFVPLAKCQRLYIMPYAAVLTVTAIRGGWTGAIVFFFVGIVFGRRRVAVIETRLSFLGECFAEFEV